MPIPDLAEKQEPIEKSVNAYYAIVGFKAAASEDMQKIGYKVVDEFKRYVVDKDDLAFNVEQVPKASELQIKGDSNILYQLIRDGQFSVYLTKNKQKILNFKLKNQQLYTRYRELITYKNFHEDSFYIPTWSGILSIPRLK